MISSTPKSKLSKKEFFKRLDEAQKDYLEDQSEYDEYYEYTGKKEFIEYVYPYVKNYLNLWYVK